MTATDPVENLKKLIACPSVTPAEAGALSAIEAMLTPLGFSVERMTAREADTADVENLYARLGTAGPHLMFAGHVDVVPPGDAAAWRFPPFSPTVADGVLYGRGAVDMKGGIACFVAAAARVITARGAPRGSISLLITGDEEGPSINGTEKLLKWAAERGERWDAALVGEPTNPDSLGDMIKIGRRGSLSGTVTVFGVQGHAAYPHLADNPVRGLLALAAALMDPPFDGGTDDFQPSNLEVTSIDVGNPATNVIPAKAVARFNIRFNDAWSPERLRAEIVRRLEAAAADGPLRPGRQPVRFELSWSDRPSEVFITRNNALISALSAAIEAETGVTPRLSTTGGTSDARFIKDYCPVVEFGLVGKTMHMVDECAALSDIEGLTRIYETFIDRWFAHAGT